VAATAAPCATKPDIDLSQGTLKCNCSICRKTRAWLVGLSADDFRLVKGQDALSDYQFGSKNIHHLFCKHCGVKSVRARGGGTRRQTVSSRCAAEHDRPTYRMRTSPRTPVMYIDGRNDNFAAAPAETRYL
jgi:hypothetical protein